MGSVNDVMLMMASNDNGKVRRRIKCFFILLQKIMPMPDGETFRSLDAIGIKRLYYIKEGAPDADRVPP